MLYIVMYLIVISRLQSLTVYTGRLEQTVDPVQLVPFNAADLILNYK